MQIEIQKLDPDGEQFEGEEPVEILGLGPQDTVRVTSPVGYDVFAQQVDKELLVQGRLTFETVAACGRCAEMFSTKVSISDFLRAFEISAGQEPIDLTDDIREEVLLHLPRYPVCGSDCKGLCPQCGHNLNDGACGCEVSRGDLRWTGLDDLKLK
jgi:uncharacterized protein